MVAGLSYHYTYMTEKFAFIAYSHMKLCLQNWIRVWYLNNDSRSNDSKGLIINTTHTICNTRKLRMRTKTHVIIILHFPSPKKIVHVYAKNSQVYTSNPVPIWRASISDRIPTSSVIVLCNLIRKHNIRIIFRYRIRNSV